VETIKTADCGYRSKSVTAA